MVLTWTMRVKDKKVQRIAQAALQELQHAHIEHGANEAELVSAGLHVARLMLSGHINTAPPKERARRRLVVTRAIQSLMLQVASDTVPM